MKEINVRARAIVFAVSVSSVASALADTAIETETAQLEKQGESNFSQSYEWAHASGSNGGSAGGSLTQWEYAITDRAEILVEPFFYVWDHPKGEPKEHGYGDLEITPSYMFVEENGWIPAMLIATKVKVPTGTQKVGGSGEYDYYPYLIFGQHFGSWTFNANAGVDFQGKEEGGGFTHQTVWDLEAEHVIAGKWTTFWEAYSAEDGVRTASTSLEYQWTNNLNVFGVVAYNQDHETIVRAGFNIQF